MTAANVGPERLAGQGLDSEQHESGNKAIFECLTSPEGEAWTDFVATCRGERDGTSSYEAWARRGMVRWIRTFAEEGGYDYQVVEVIGQNPLAAQDYRALSTYEAELGAAIDGPDPLRAFIPHERITYPYAYERLSQLFDHPNAPDLAVNSEAYAFALQPGQHGNLDVVQSRSPLIFCGPGVKRGAMVDAPARQIDIAPTIAFLMGFPFIDGRDLTGRSCTEQGLEPGVYFKRQDGHVLMDVVDDSGTAPERVYLFLLDGQSHTQLLHRLESESHSIPNLRRLVTGGAMLQHGSITNFPSITWPSHNAIGTGCWSGHHGIVNPSYYLRDRRETISPQGAQFDTAKCLDEGVETLFEAFHRVYGRWDGVFGGALTASIIEPCTRGADHATLENRVIGEKDRLKALTAETAHEINPRWKEELEEFGHKMMGEIDNRGLAQARLLFMDEAHCPPKFVFHEFSQPDAAAHDYGPHHEAAREALDETDRRIGHILRLLDEQGLSEKTLFIVTTDHGMACQDTALGANAARIPERHGMAAVTVEPLVYLLDLRVEVEVAHDGRSGRVWVSENDVDARGSRPPLPGARLLITDKKDGVVVRATTGADGLAGFALPADVRAHDLAMSVQADGFNARHLRLDGTNLALDLREALYSVQK
ncbi:MAG: alkaline phosphatase family protein [Dehalococcoidia bacterium]